PYLLGTFNSRGFNLIGQSDGSSGFTNGVHGDLTGTTGNPLDPKLGPQDNGGLSLTMPLLPGSPAIDAGDDLLLSAPYSLTTDQRGRSRKSGAHVDIGAYELQFPEALCANAIVSAGTHCMADAMVNNGSFHPDGLAIVITQSP